MHTNICFLEGNFHKLEVLLHNLDYNFDVIALTETWRVEGNKNFAPGRLGNYSKYEGLPRSSRKGGCGFYINKAITYINRLDLDKRHKGKNSEFEAKWIEVMYLSVEKIIIGSIYRHPKPNDHSVLNNLKETNKKIWKKKKRIILTGDFNLNLLIFEKNKEAEEFIQFLIAQWFTPQILGPTRIPQHEKLFLIDNIFISFPDLICTIGNFTEKVTDHLLNFLITENIDFKMKIKEEAVRRDFDKQILIKNFNELKINTK